MKRWICLLAVTAYSGCSSQTGVSSPDLGPSPDLAPNPLSVTIDQGVVNGMASGTTRLFLGIPYAAPPTGTLRWKSPQPPAPFSAPLDATKFGADCPQIPITGGWDANGNEDCLTLNIWTPADTSAPHAVMVWLYGGGFVLGATSDAMYDGTKLSAAGDVVVVTVNYRLGPLGFLAHPLLDAEDPSHPGSGSWGFEDQRAALGWVKSNIAAFGGDPSQVTVFGESAGGFSTCLHALSTPSAGLFQRVLIESGPCVLPLPTEAQAETQGAQLATALGCTSGDVLACMRGIGAQQVTTALPLKSGFFLGSGASWGPVVDGVNFTEEPLATIEAGGLAKVPALLGANHDEGTLFVTLAKLNLASDGDYSSAVGAVFGSSNAAAIVAQYPEASYASYNAAFSDVLGDGLFVCPTRGLAQAFSLGGQPAFLYSFEHAITTILGDLGAFHSSEVGFVFGNGWEGTPLTAPEMSLSTAMQGYWTRFGAAGDPNGMSAVAWPAYATASDQNLDLDLTIASGANLKKAKCDFWSSLLP